MSKNSPDVKRENISLFQREFPGDWRIDEKSPDREWEELSASGGRVRGVVRWRGVVSIWWESEGSG